MDLTGDTIQRAIAAWEKTAWNNEAFLTED